MVFLLLVIIIIMIIIFINVFRRVFSMYTEANATSLIPLLPLFLRNVLLSLVISYTVWTKMRCLAGSLVDDVLADAILNFPRLLIPPTNIRKVRDP